MCLCDMAVCLPALGWEEAGAAASLWAWRGARGRGSVLSLSLLTLSLYCLPHLKKDVVGSGWQAVATRRAETFPASKSISGRRRGQAEASMRQAGGKWHRQHEVGADMLRQRAQLARLAAVCRVAQCPSPSCSACHASHSKTHLLWKKNHFCCGRLLGMFLCARIALSWLGGRQAGNRVA